MLIVGDGVLQAVGAIGIVAGILLPSHHHRSSTTTTASIHFAPVSYGRGRPGLAAFGRF